MKQILIPCDAEDSAPIPMTRVEYEYPFDLNVDRDHCYHPLPSHGFNPLLGRDPDRHRWNNGHPNTIHFTFSIR